MKKKRNVILLVLIVLLVVCSVNAVYEKYYKINFGDYHSIHFVAAADSPDKKHSVGVTAYKKDVDADEVYLSVVLYNNETDNYLQDGKIILWDKVQASEIELLRQEPDVLKYSVQVEWINPESILINERIVDINKVYDYRRD